MIFLMLLPLGVFSLSLSIGVYDNLSCSFCALIGKMPASEICTTCYDLQPVLRCSYCLRLFSCIHTFVYEVFIFCCATFMLYSILLNMPLAHECNLVREDH
jgi:hypothetical protein